MPMIVDAEREAGQLAMASGVAGGKAREFEKSRSRMKNFLRFSVSSCKEAEREWDDVKDREREKE